MRFKIKLKIKFTLQKTKKKNLNLNKIWTEVLGDRKDKKRKFSCLCNYVCSRYCKVVLCKNIKKNKT